MSKIRFYVKSQYLSERVVINDNNDVHKIKNVLRLNPGGEVFLFDGEGREWRGEIISATPREIVISRKDLNRESPALAGRIILGFPLLKQEKIDLILQKAVELGVDELVPFTCRYSISAFPSSDKLQRWRKIIIEAARQSERLWLPFLREPVEFPAAVKTPCALKLAASFKGVGIEKLPSARGDIFIITGPEGDFSPEEEGILGKEGFLFLNLGKNILRAETAAIFSVGIADYFLRQNQVKKD